MHKPKPKPKDKQYDNINPAHYVSRVKLISGPTVELQVADVITAFFKEDGLLSQAMKYLGRAGRKPDSSYVECLKKCRWWIDKAITEATSSSK